MKVSLTQGLQSIDHQGGALRRRQQAWQHIQQQQPVLGFELHERVMFVIRELRMSMISATFARLLRSSGAHS